jgi:hypothetical protein
MVNRKRKERTNTRTSFFPNEAHRFSRFKSETKHAISFSPAEGLTWQTYIFTLQKQSSRFTLPLYLVEQSFKRRYSKHSNIVFLYWGFSLAHVHFHAPNKERANTQIPVSSKTTPCTARITRANMHADKRRSFLAQI